MPRTDTTIRRALVTGASSGIGEEFARQLAARGTDLVLVARREERLHELADELRARGRDVEVVPADLTEARDLARIEARLETAVEPVDLLVNNAGFGLYGPFAELDRDRQAAMVDLNATAVVRLTHAAVGRLVTVDHGGVINVASTAAFQPDPYGAVYGATKAFVLSFTEALHEELRATGVRAMALCPGFTVTEFQDVADVQDGAMPAPGVMEVGPVVREGLDAFTRGRAVCLPGLVNKLTAGGAGVTPSAVTRRLSKLTHRRFVG